MLLLRRCNCRGQSQLEITNIWTTKHRSRSHCAALITHERYRCSLEDPADIHLGWCGEAISRREVSFFCRLIDAIAIRFHIGNCDSRHSAALNDNATTHSARLSKPSCRSLASARGDAACQRPLSPRKRSAPRLLVPCAALARAAISKAAAWPSNFSGSGLSFHLHAP